MHCRCQSCIYESLPYQVREIKKNQILFLEGDEIDHVYQIESGFVKVVKYQDSGHEKVFDIFGPGDFLALLLVLQSQKKYQVSVIALNTCRLKVIRKEEIQKAYQSHPVFQKMCLQCASSRATIFQHQLFQTSFQDVDEKIMGILIYLYHKFGVYKDGRHRLYLPINQSELASIIGIRRETLSRRLSDLQDQGRLTFGKYRYEFHKI